MDTTFTLPQIVTAAVALLSAVVAFVALRRTTKVQQQQLRLQHLQEVGLRASLALYLEEGYIRRLGPTASRIYVFEIIVSNLSDVPNSVRELRLLIEHGQGHGHGPSSNLMTPHRREVGDRLLEKSDATLTVPFTVGARSSVAGRALFEVAADLLKDTQVESYSVQVVDTYGHITGVDALLVSERSQ